MEPSERELLIRLDEGQKFLIKRLGDMEDRLKAADESRARLHDRLNIQQEDIYIVGNLVAQHRNFLQHLGEKIDANHEKVEPALEQWQEIKTLGKYMSIVFISLGVTGASALVWAKSWFEQVSSWFKS